MQNTKQEIIQRIKEYLFKDRTIIFAYMHGSFLADNKFKDIDVALYIDELILGNIEPVDLEIRLSLELEKLINYSIDVKILNSAILSFRYQASCGLLILSRDEIKREEFLCKTWSEYFDFLPMARIYLKEVLSG